MVENQDGRDVAEELREELVVATTGTPIESGEDVKVSAREHKEMLLAQPQARGWTDRTLGIPGDGRARERSAREVRPVLRRAQCTDPWWREGSGKQEAERLGGRGRDC